MPLIVNQALAAPEYVQLVEAIGEGHALSSLNSDGLLGLVQKAHDWGASEQIRLASAAGIGQAVVDAARERLEARLRQKEQMSAFVNQFQQDLRGETSGDDSDEDAGWSD